MSVVIETTLGTVTVDLYISTRPRACLNFLKLCKMKYYNFNLFHTISRGFIAQTGDPTGTRSGGESIFGVIDGPEKRYFECENEPRIKHTKMGLISFVGNDEHMIGSQFFITLGDDLIYLDEQHCVFGEVVEGFDILEAINEVICDTDDRPYQDVRITHTVVLDDPFPDPNNLQIPSRSPSPSADRLQGGRIAPDEDVDESEGKTAAEISEMQAEREAKARATILEMVGDIPDADMAPPENVLFVCKLNPVTTDDDLEVIFNRFGKIKSCEVIRDRKTGDSLQYAFIEFEDQKSCEDAYFKMDNILIDDRRIHVDFSQSVSKVRWMGKGRGVKHYDERGKLSNREDRNIGKGDYKQKNYYKNDRNCNKSPDNKDNGRYSPYKTSERNKQSRHRRSRSRSNYDRPKERDDRSRASYYKGKSSKDCSDRDLSSNQKHTSHQNRSRSKLLSIDCSSSTKRYDEKSEGRDRYDKSRRNREENPQPERSNNNNRGIGKSRRNRSKSVESRTDRKNNMYQKTIHSKSEKNHKSKRRRSSSHSSDSDSKDDRSIQVDKKKKQRSINDEHKKGLISLKKSKSKYREKSNITSSDSEDENKDQRISKVKKTKSYNSKKYRDSSDSDEHKRKSKNKSKSYQSTSSDLDETRYKKKKKSKPHRSSTPSSSDSDSDKNSKRKKKLKRKKKYASDSE